VHRKRDNWLALILGQDSDPTRGAKQMFDPTKIAGAGTTAQDQADVWMGDQATGIVDHNGVAGAANSYRCNYIPD